jgi:hypothetical protein
MLPRSSESDRKDLQSAASAVVEEAASVVEDAALVVESAAAVVQEAAAVVQEAAAAESSWPTVERRRKPRLLRRLHDEGKVQWKHIALYIPVLLLVVIIGAFALWSFFEKQTVRAVEPVPLPKISLITADPRSPFTAAWVRLLTDAEMQPTLVPLDKVEVLQGVVVFCNVPAIPPSLIAPLNAFIQRGGAVAVIGQPPSTPIGPISLSADSGMSDGSFKFAEAVSPVLARLEPGRQIWVKASPVAFLKETPRMNIDARWATNARAVIMHEERDGTRYLWFGFDPNALQNEDRQLMLLLRTAFRWVAGQPISEGAVGALQTATSFSPSAREAAHAQGLTFSVDPIGGHDFRVWIANRGKAALQNPTIKIWLPPGVTRVALGGDFLMKRNVTLTGIPEDGACLISMPRLNPRIQKVLKLEIVARR